MRAPVVVGIALAGVLLAPTTAYAEHAGPPGPPVPSSHGDPLCAFDGTNCEPQSSTHQVRQGEWLWKIARTKLARQGKSTATPNVRKIADMIYADNRRIIGPNKNRLRVGQRLTIRATDNWPRLNN